MLINVNDVMTSQCVAIVLPILQNLPVCLSVASVFYLESCNIPLFQSSPDITICSCLLLFCTLVKGIHDIVSNNGWF